jgi:uncharacterized membrane protein
MYSRLKIFGHPIHPMLVAYPIALYTSTLVAYLIYIVGHDDLCSVQSSAPVAA